MLFQHRDVFVLLINDVYLFQYAISRGLKWHSMENTHIYVVININWNTPAFATRQSTVISFCRVLKIDLANLRAIIQVLDPSKLHHPMQRVIQLSTLQGHHVWYGIFKEKFRFMTQQCVRRLNFPKRMNGTFMIFYYNECVFWNTYFSCHLAASYQGCFTQFSFISHLSSHIYNWS